GAATEYLCHVVEEHQRQGVITGLNVQIRSGPSLDDHIIGSAAQGDTFEVIDTEEGWKKIVLHTEEHGWIAEQFTSNAPSSEPVNQLEIQPKEEETSIQDSPSS